MTNAERCRAYYERHRAERLARQAAYYEAHRDERIAYARSYQTEHQAEHRQATERHRKQDPEATRAYHRAYYRQTVERQRVYKAAEQRAAKRKMVRDPVKTAARDAVAVALKNGTVVKPVSCTKCGKETTPRRLHAHHTDYSKPLLVTWLCSLCHGEQHQRKAS